MDATESDDSERWEDFFGKLLWHTKYKAAAINFGWFGAIITK